MDHMQYQMVLRAGQHLDNTEGRGNSLICWQLWRRGSSVGVEMKVAVLAGASWEARKGGLAGIICLLVCISQLLSPRAFFFSPFLVSQYAATNWSWFWTLHWMLENIPGAQTSILISSGPHLAVAVVPVWDCPILAPFPGSVPAPRALEKGVGLEWVARSVLRSGLRNNCRPAQGELVLSEGTFSKLKTNQTLL